MNVKEIEAARPGDVIRDDQVRGLRIRAFPGRKSWYVYYRTVKGQRREPKIGEYPEVKIGRARTIAQAMLDQVRAGSDPSRERRAKEKTVAELADRFMREHAAHLKAPEKFESALRLHILPVIGKLGVREVDYDDVARIRERLRDRPIQANRTLSVLSKMFTLAETWRLRDQHTNPTRGVTRFRERGRKRYLQPEEIPALAKALDELEPLHPFQIALFRLELLTGARGAELRKAKWADYQPARSRIYLEDSKSGEEREIYLGRRAVEILEHLPRESEWIFPGRQYADPPKPLAYPNYAWEKVRQISGLRDLRMHDLRHSFASLRLASGANLDTIGMMLGHKDAKTTRRYAHLIEDFAKAQADEHGALVARLMESGVP